MIKTMFTLEEMEKSGLYMGIDLIDPYFIENQSFSSARFISKSSLDPISKQFVIYCLF